MSFEVVFCLNFPCYIIQNFEYNFLGIDLKYPSIDVKLLSLSVGELFVKKRAKESLALFLS